MESSNLILPNLLLGFDSKETGPVFKTDPIYILPNSHAVRSIMLDLIKSRFYQLIPAVDFCSLRYLAQHSETLTLRQNVAQPPVHHDDEGVMITVINKGGLGYAATSDLSDSGLQRAITTATQWTQLNQPNQLIDFAKLTLPHPRGEYATIVKKPWNSLSSQAKFDLLYQESMQCQLNDKIIDWQISLQSIQTEQLYLTNQGGEVKQTHHYLLPTIKVIANQGINTQHRTLKGHGHGRQGGLEILDDIDFWGKGQQLAEEALQLLAAPNCPNKIMDLVLAPDQMALQIHESIGHPLELDRILGDERNYAGTSFVTADMFGRYQYGSHLLNVTYDPTLPEQLASYGFDDDGLLAEKVYLIRNGILTTPLGGHLSQARAGLPGVANARATNWNRPPIDRMANLNIEPGNSRFEDIIHAIEQGIFMQSNSSWSIDDSRNKFQFGCEWGQLIENGELTQVVKNPNYRGISATFWRNLQQVGNRDTFEVLGVLNCGKGEPNQGIMVGHASPVCAFAQVDVFGGV